MTHAESADQSAKEARAHAAAAKRLAATAGVPWSQVDTKLRKARDAWLQAALNYGRAGLHDKANRAERQAAAC